MPKVKKIPGGKKGRHDPLHQQILDAAKPTVKKWRQKEDEEEEESGIIPEALSKRILVAAEKQAEDEILEGHDFDDGASMASLQIGLDSEDEEPDEDGYVCTGHVMDPEEEKAMQMFLQTDTGDSKKGNDLSDFIMAAISNKEKQEAVVSGPSHGLSDRVLNVYRSMAPWMKNYRSGKIPKAFKIIPNLVNWEQIIYLTQPHEWSPNAMREATKIFAANLNPKMAQRFYNLVLLPAVRQNIAEYGRLNFHYYEALKKALFKPAAFVKGILLPLADQNCTVREAVILSSVLAKVSVPVMHSAVAIMKLCALKPWYATSSILIMTLIQKKYALPYRVISAVAEHFLSFISDTRELPVIWYRCLLALVQKYKYDLQPKHKEQMKELMKLHPHEICHEIRRELFAAPPRELRAAADAMVIC